MENRYEEYYNDVESINYTLYTDCNKIDYKDVLSLNLEEFSRRNDIDPNNKTKDIKKVFEQYGLDLNFIVTEYSKNKEDEKGKQEYRIPKISEDILAVMIKNSKKNKIRRKKDENITINDFIEYNENIFELIEELPMSIKKEIKKDKIYEKNLEINELLYMLSERINLFLNIFVANQSIDSGVMKMKKLITYIDKLLYDYAYSKKINEENLKGEYRKYFEKEEKKREQNKDNYMLEVVFRKVFLNSIKKNIEVLDYLKTKEIPVEEIQNELNEISKNYKNENSIQILYESKVCENNKEKYDKKLLEENKNLNNKYNKIKKLAEKNKYFFNVISCKNVIKGVYENEKENILKVIFGFDKRSSYEEFLYNYNEYWQDSILSQDKFVRDYVLSCGYSFNYSKSISVFEREKLIDEWNKFTCFLEDEIISNLEEFNEEMYFKWVDKKFNNEESKKEFILYLDEKVYAYIKDIKENDQEVIDILKSMYKNINKKEEKRNDINRSIENIDKKIEKEKKELLKIKQEKNKKNINIIESNIKELKEKRNNLQTKLSNIRDLKNSVHNMFGKMIINVLYMDRDYMMNNKIDLKKYLHILNKSSDKVDLDVDVI